MDVPKPQPIAPTDPRLIAQAAQAANDQTTALMTQASGDSASLMARYGTRLALAGTAAGSPLTMGPTGSPLVSALTTMVGRAA